MAGMVPDIWGPMTWRAIHGAAHRYDASDATIDRDADVFVLVLLRIAFVLPCVHCRDSFVKYLAQLGAEGMVSYFKEKNVRRLLVDLHNLVNAKLGKPKHRYDVAILRDKVWSVGFSPREFIGLLFIIALNYVNNGEEGKQRHYRLFFHVLPDFALAMDEPRLAAALERVREVTDSIQIELAVETYQTELVQALREGLIILEGSAPSYDALVERYNLCKSNT